MSAAAVTRIGLSVVFMLIAGNAAQAQEQSCADAKYSDSHFHLTNYVQEGTDVGDYLKMMGTTVCRSTLFGILCSRCGSMEIPVISRRPTTSKRTNVFAHQPRRSLPAARR